MSETRADPRAGRILTWAIVLVALTMLALSLASKQSCLGGPYDETGSSPQWGNANRLYCYSDLQQLWTGRGIAEGEFPYVHGEYVPPTADAGANLVSGAIEYPVVTGLFMWLSVQPADNVTQYVFWTVLFMAPFAAATAWMLARMCGRRAFFWAAAPALAIYGAFNWDVLPVAMVVGAVYAWWRGHRTLAGALLGLGAATKIYPGFFLLPLVIERLVAKDVRGAVRVGLAGVGTWLAVNLPFMVVNWDGWWATYQFQMVRTPDLSTNSIYFWYSWGVPDAHLAGVGLLSVALISACWATALALGWILRPPSGVYPWVQVSAAMLCGFLAFNKVYSPQYIMWLLPFFALVTVRWGWWVAVTLTDLVLFIGLFRWYDVMGQGGGFSLGEQMASMAGWVKTVLFALLVVVFTLTRSTLDDQPPPENAGKATDGHGCPDSLLPGSAERPAEPSETGAPA